MPATRSRIFVPPTEVAHNRVDLDITLAPLQEARTRHDIRDLVVAVERTGRYHHVPRNAPWHIGRLATLLRVAEPTPQSPRSYTPTRWWPRGCQSGQNTPGLKRLPWFPPKGS